MRKLFPTFLFLTSTLFAQLPLFRPFFSTTDREFGKLFFYEVINLISEDTSKSRIDVNFRIANDLLTFVKNPLSSQHTSQTLQLVRRSLIKMANQ